MLRGVFGPGCESILHRVFPFTLGNAPRPSAYPLRASERPRPAALHLWGFLHKRRS
jgi:hypothetical protein